MKVVMRYGRITVSVILLMAMLAGSLICLIPAKAEPLHTYHSSWHLIRETADEDGANFAAVYASATTMNFANKDSSSVANGGPFRIVPQKSGNDAEGYSRGAAWDIAICGGDADNDTFSFSLVGWSRINGMLQVIGEGTGILGAQAVVLYPDDSATATNIFWADTIVLSSTTKWNTIRILNSGANQVAIIHIDMAGLEWVQLVIYDADGTTGIEAGDITSFGKRY